MSNAVFDRTLSVASPPCVSATFCTVPLFVELKPGRTKCVNVWLKLKNVVPPVPISALTRSSVSSMRGIGLATGWIHEMQRHEK